MADFISGVVEKITTREGSYGTMYNIVVGGVYYGMGSIKPHFGEGSDIDFDAEQKGKFWNVVKGSIEVVTLVEPKPERGGRDGGRGERGGRSEGRGGRDAGGRGNSRDTGSRAPARSTGGGSSATMSKDDYWKQKELRDIAKEEEWRQKDQRIELQSCRNSAIALVSAALAHDAVKLPAKQADKWDALKALVDELTGDYVEANNAIMAPEEKEEAPSRPARGGRRAAEVEDDLPEYEEDDAPFEEDDQ